MANVTWSWPRLRPGNLETCTLECMGTTTCSHERVVYVRAGEYGGEPGPGSLTVGRPGQLEECKGICADDVAWCEDCGALGVAMHVIRGQVIGELDS